MNDERTPLDAPLKDGTRHGPLRPEPNTVDRYVTGSKDGILMALAGRVDHEMVTFRRPQLARHVREHALGFAEGVQFAMDLIRDWQLPVAVPEPSPVPTQEDVT